MRLSLDNIALCVSRYYNVPVTALRMADQSVKGTRCSEYAKPRQMAYFLSRNLTNRSYPEIGRFFGGRHHTTVMHGAVRVKELIESDPDVDQAACSILSMLDQ